MNHITLQWDWFYLEDTVVILWIGSGLRASLRSVWWFVQCYVTLSMHAQTSMWGNRRNEARIHGHLCQESAAFMDFPLINKCLGFVDQLLPLKGPFLLTFVGLPFFYEDQRFSSVWIGLGVFGLLVWFWCVGLLVLVSFLFFFTFIGVFKSKEEFCTFSSATPLQVKNVTACESAARANNNLTDMSWHWNAY